MKKQIGLVLVAGLLAAGCRPLGLPVLRDPVVTETPPTTATAGPTTTLGTDGASDASQPPAFDVDLADLDALMTELDTVLSDVDGALKEGEEE